MASTGWQLGFPWPMWRQSSGEGGFGQEFSGHRFFSLLYCLTLEILTELILCIFALRHRSSSTV